MPSSLDNVLYFFEMGSSDPVLGISTLAPPTGVISWDVEAAPRQRLFSGRVWAQIRDYTDDPLTSLILERLASRLERRSWKLSSVEDQLRQYRVPLNESFEKAALDYPSITINQDVMAGAPCIRDTRIPVYMVLDAIEHYGEVEAALRSYPRLSIQQVKDAIGFTKLVVECPIDDKTSSTA